MKNTKNHFRLALILGMFGVSLACSALTDHGMEMTDYSNFNRSHKAVYDVNTGNWYIKDINTADPLVFGQNWGFKGAIPVPGVFNADGFADLAVYDTNSGRWYIKHVTGGVFVNGEQWGFKGAIPVAGDYDGDGVSDQAVYDTNTGNWYIKTVSNITLFQGNWGFKGAVPVPGDYNGDGTYDLAVYELSTGKWFIRTIGGSVLTYGQNWGYKNAIPVAGDYDGDGDCDLAVYDKNTGFWFIKQINGVVLVNAQNFGYKGALPVSGDFDGDGIADLAVYDTNAGNWYIRPVDKDAPAIRWGSNFGYKGALPVYSISVPAAGDLGVPAIQSGFLWKPISDNEGKLVVLLPGNYRGQVQQCWLAREDGLPIESGRYTGIGNGGKLHYRFSRQGRDYGRNIYVLARLRSGALVHWFVANGGARTAY